MSPELAALALAWADPTPDPTNDFIALAYALDLEVLITDEIPETEL